MQMTRERTAKSQLGYQTALGNNAYTFGAGDISFANGQLILLRFPTTLPRKAGINSATINFNMVVKTNTTTQQSIHRIWAHASGDSPMLVPGREEWAQRPGTDSFVNWTASWVAGSDPGGALVYNTVNIQPLLQELVYRDDWLPGGYVTLEILCLDEQGSDMGIRANNDFLPTPRIDVDFTEPLSDERFTVNMCENSEFGTAIQSIGTDGNQVPYWSQGNYYGAFVDPANQGTMARDTSFTRLPGVPTLRFTCGTPPTDTTKRTGPSYSFNDNLDQGTVLCGWIYVPVGVGPSTAGDVFVGDPFRGGAGKYITARGQWVPFCTEPDPIVGTPWGPRFFTVGLRNYSAGQQFWISEPAFIRSTFRQMPFNGLTPDREPGIVHLSTATGMASIRVWTPRKVFSLNGIFPRAYPTWMKRDDGILQLAEPTRGGRPTTELTGTVASLPAGKSVSEL